MTIHISVIPSVDYVQQRFVSDALFLGKVYEAGVGYLYVHVALSHQLVELLLGWLAARWVGFLNVLPKNS